MNIIADILGTGLEMCILYKLQKTTVPKKNQQTVFLLYLLLGIIIITITSINFPLIIKLSFIFIYTLAITLLCYQSDVKRIIFCFILYLLFISIGEVIGSVLITQLLGITNEAAMNSKLCFFCIVLLSKTITLFFTSYFIHFVEKMPKNKDLFLTVTPLLSCFLVLFLQALHIYNQKSSVLLTNFTTFTIVVSVFLVIILIEKYNNTKELEHITNMDIKQINNNYQYLCKKVESQEKVMELYHDLKNHLLILQTKDENPEYINGLLDKISDFELFTETGNSILNTIIYEKKKFSKVYQINFSSHINLNYVSVLKDYDICSIFGNALDNSIESCLKIENIEERYINICADKIKQFLIIKIENASCPENINLASPYSTTKSDINLHGHGLKSIQRTIQKYNGELQIRLTDHKFIMNIAIPICQTAC